MELARVVLFAVLALSSSLTWAKNAKERRSPLESIFPWMKTRHLAWPRSSSPVLISASVHLEGWGSSNYEAHARSAEDLAASADAYGVKITFEAELPFLQGQAAAGGSFLSDAVAAGHAVGAHADLAAYETNSRRAADHLADLYDGMVAAGVDPLHLSGQCSALDWVQMTQDAGFVAVTGVMAYCLQSMPVANWPAGYEEFEDCEAPNLCHLDIPETTENAVNPWFANNGEDWDWENPATSGLLIVPSVVNLKCAAEYAAGDYETNCGFTEEDETEIIARLEEAIAMESTGDYPKTFHLIWSFGGPIDSATIEAFFSRLKTYVDDEVAEFKTVPEIVEQYK